MSISPQLYKTLKELIIKSQDEVVALKQQCSGSSFDNMHEEETLINLIKKSDVRCLAVVCDQLVTQKDKQPIKFMFNLGYLFIHTKMMRKLFNMRVDDRNFLCWTRISYSVAVKGIAWVVPV